MIHASDISKTYGRVRALDRTTFELPAGQVAGLLGPNGAGKTTTIRILTGTTPPDSGDVTVAGASIRREPMLARRRMGYLPEHNPLYPEMTPEAYLHHRGRLFGLDRKARVAAIEREVSRCEIGAMRNRRISALSKGFRQRVGLAAALLHDPEVLILDEPTNGLDPTQVHQARLLITELAEKRTVLLCTHILPEVERLCDRVMVLVAGKVRADGTPAELARDHAGAPTYRMEIRTNPSADALLAPRSLSTVHGVSRIDLAPVQPVDATVGWQTLIITAHRDSSDLREPLAGACADAGYFIREINRERVGLESLFMRLIEDEAPPPPTEPAPTEPSTTETPTTETLRA